MSETSAYFTSDEQTEAHSASIIVYWGADFARPNLLVGVAPIERAECEACGEKLSPLKTVVFDMDDAIVEAFELAIAKWREARP